MTRWSAIPLSAALLLSIACNVWQARSLGIAGDVAAQLQQHAEEADKADPTDQPEFQPDPETAIARLSKGLAAADPVTITELAASSDPESVNVYHVSGTDLTGAPIDCTAVVWFDRKSGQATAFDRLD